MPSSELLNPGFTMRYALYFSPPHNAPLAVAAAAWLGRDPFTGETSPPPEVAGLDTPALTAAPRRYGFHGTLKAPFRLAEGQREGALRAAMEAFCVNAAPFHIPRLTVGQLGPFFALVPDGPVADLNAHADAVVRHFEPFRAPLNADELARRKPETLGERERAYLMEWGYPYIFDAFRFHMTLTGPVDESWQDAVEAELVARFEPLLSDPVPVDALSLFVEPAPGTSFLISARVPFQANT
ncbi:MAG: DUF1045 domain-containing protein [Pseudomonadota bacterium]